MKKGVGIGVRISLAKSVLAPVRFTKTFKARSVLSHTLSSFSAQVPENRERTSGNGRSNAGVTSDGHLSIVDLVAMFPISGQRKIGGRSLSTVPEF